MIPEWAPSIHPLIVHFPVALLVVAFGTDALSFVLKRQRFLLPAANGLYVLGAVAALAAFLSGREGADAIIIPSAAMGTLTDHADWAQRTAWLYGLVAVTRLALLRDTHALRGKGLHVICLLLGAASMWPLYKTGDLGAQLVFRFGVGVQAVEDGSLQAEEAHAEHDVHQHPEGPHHTETNTDEPSPTAKPVAVPQNAVPLLIESDGSWAWNGDADGANQLQWDFIWLQGNPKAALAGLGQDGAESWVRIKAAETVFFVVEQSLSHVQATLLVNADEFEGTIRLMHHIKDPANYNYMELVEKNVRLGAVSAGKEEVQDEATYDQKGWLALKAVGHKTHFRGYIGEKMVAHGHGAELPAGRVGLMIRGSGVLGIKNFEAEALE